MYLSPRKKIFVDTATEMFGAGAVITKSQKTAAADKAGVSIPSMCFLKGCAASTSCMVCVVRVNAAQSLVPACGTKAVDGMVVESDSPEVLAARKTALELLLSDHVGDCMGPCHVTCPAKMDIPVMIRQIAAGEFAEAIKTVKKDIPLPAVLGRICPAPCENACRRRLQDSAVSICLLKRFVAAQLDTLGDTELRSLDQLLDLEDDLLWDWLSGREIPPQKDLDRLVERIRTAR